MAEPENMERSPSPELPGVKAGGPLARILPWSIPAVAVVVFAAGGFLIGRSFGTRGPAQTAAAAEPTPEAESTPIPKEGKGDIWYYELDPIVVNLNEPGVTRYVRIGLTLEINSTLSQEEGKPFLDERKPVMKHWLTLFLADQTIEDMRGLKNLTRMETQITDTLNTNLFPDGKPRIKGILFREFAIQ